MMLLAALLLAAPAGARDAVSCGAELRALDARTGKQVGALRDERMASGPTGARAESVRLSAAAPGPFVRARYKRCPQGSAAAAESATTLSERSVVLALPSLEEAMTFAPVRDTRPQDKPLPREMNDSGDSWVRTSSHLLTMAGGEVLRCVDASAGGLVWERRLVPRGMRVAGAEPSFDVYDRADHYLVVTDRLGMFALRKDDGRELWHHSYSNADEVPSVLITSGAIVAGPIRANR